MAETKTPEAAPEQPKNSAEKTAPKPAPVAPETKAPAPVLPEKDPNDIDQSIWSISREKVRGPMQKLFLAGAFAAAPWVVGGAYLGDKILSKIPVVNSVYNIPKSIVANAGSTALDVAAATVTAPTAIIDIEENIREGFTGNVQKEARGMLESMKEKTFETVGWTGRQLHKGLELGAKGLKEGLKLGAEAIKMPLAAAKEGVEAINGTLKQIPIVGPAMPLVTAGALAWGGHSLLLNTLPGMSPALGEAYSTASSYLFDMVKTGWQSIW